MAINIQTLSCIQKIHVRTAETNDITPGQIGKTKDIS